jgi:uncharacterized protein
VYKKLLLLSLIMLLVLATPALAAMDIPQPESNFYCLDKAGMLTTETENAIINASKNLEQKTGAQIVVVTVPTLGEGVVLEEYSLELFRQWGIGDKEKNNGVLLLISREERKSRIEVGYGLEGALPDAKTGRIQDGNLIPFFKEEKYDLGVINTYNALLKEVAAEYNIPYEPISSGTSSQPSANNENDLSWPAIIGILVMLYIIFRVIRSGGGSSGGPRSGGGGGYYRGGGGYFGGGGGFGRGGGFGGGGSAGGGGSSRGW